MSRGPARSEQHVSKARKLPNTTPADPAHSPTSYERPARYPSDSIYNTVIKLTVLHNQDCSEASPPSDVLQETQ